MVLSLPKFSYPLARIKVKMILMVVDLQNGAFLKVPVSASGWKRFFIS